MEFVFLGTGAGVPSKGRNVSAIALQLLEERGQTWLFDCGEADATSNITYISTSTPH